MNLKMNRRQVLKTGAALGLGGMLPLSWDLRAAETFRPSRSPNEKLNIAMIGVAAQGAYNLGNVASENIVALCDIDEERLNQAAAQFPNATKYFDYRKVFDRNDLDAAVIATPDHTHAIAAVRALQAGLDVYCEKPLAHSVYEVRKIREWTAKQKAITQMGTQIHAGDNYRRVVEIVQGGVLGQVNRVHVWIGSTVKSGVRVKEATPPPHVHYDLWLGGAPERPFHVDHFHFNWRFWFDFGGGTLADFGCHYMDLPHWALDLRAPEAVAAVGEKSYAGDNDVPDKLKVDYHYPARGDKAPVHLTWSHGGYYPEGHESYGKGSAVLFEGEKGKLLADYGSLQLFMKPGESDKVPEPSIPASIGHHQEWILACKTRGATTCNFDYSGALAEAVLLGNVAYRAGQASFHWDAENLTAVDCPAAANFIQREYRAGWKLEA